MTRPWSVAEAAQADYETLRAAVVATGGLPATLVAARFARHGLLGLIAAPAAEPVFAGTERGAVRPPWQPHADPRVAALAAVYGLLLAPDVTGVPVREAWR